LGSGVVVEVRVVDREVERARRGGEEVEQPITRHVGRLAAVGEEVHIEIG